MNEILDTMGQTLGSILGSPAVVVGVQLAALYLVVLWLASAWWVWRDARARYRDPIAPYIAAAGILLVTPVLFPLAAVVYRVLRPSTTTAQADAAELQLTMLAEESAQSVCGRCRAPVDEEWIACPACGATLSVRCETCGRPLELDWAICAWCAADVPWSEGADLEPSVTVAPAAAPVAIPIRPGGRPLVPVMALPEESDPRLREPEAAVPGRRRARGRRRGD